MRVADSTSIASRIEQAFQTASTTTGTSFDYLLKTAARESSFQPAAESKTSSATGLFQFVEQTWLETVKDSGGRHGLQSYADQIEVTATGKYRVSDPDVRQEILDLRKDPEISSRMAGELTQKNADYLSDKLGRDPSQGELYIAHFLGAQGASRLINSAQANPESSAAQMFPAQAKANRSIFYDGTGSSRSLAEVYDVLVSKHDSSSGVMVASASAQSTDDLPKSRILTGFAAESASADPVSARVDSAFRAAETSAPFEALFRDDEGSRSATMSGSYLAAFAGVKDDHVFSRAVGGSRVVAQLAGGDGAIAQTQDGPLDLTGFLNYAPLGVKRDLLPPV
jgi:hypothetical protein